MATGWTNPKTWLAAVLTVADMNTHVRDNLKHLYETKGDARAVTTQVGTYTVLVTDGNVRCNGTFTVTLPSAATVGAGWIVHIKNIGTGVITVSGTIDGLSSIALSVNGDCLSVCSNGTDYDII